MANGKPLPKVYQELSLATARAIVDLEGVYNALPVSEREARLDAYCAWNAASMLLERLLGKGTS